MKERSRVFFPLESNEVYCLWNFLLHETNELSNQRLGLLFGPIYHALTKSNMGGYNSSCRRCFNLYLHITTSIVSICCRQKSQYAFLLRHKPYSNIIKITRFRVWLLLSTSMKHVVFMIKSWPPTLIYFEMNPMTKNIACKIYYVVKIYM